MTLLFGIFFIFIETMTNLSKLSKEVSRKSIHLVAGVSAAFLPLVITFHQIIYLSIVLIPLMLVSKWANVLTSIHSVKRTTYGEIYFPFAILLVALLFPDQPLYMYGLLIMAISDGLASVIGQAYGKRTYRVFTSRKSYIGSLAFLLSAFIITTIMAIYAGATLFVALAIAAILAIILTVVEGILSWGLDNLVLPPLASLLLMIAIALLHI